MPLTHDMPVYRTSMDEPTIRARVFPRRTSTGHLHWYWHLTRDGVKSSAILHGPYLSLSDAHDDAEKVVHFTQ